MNVAEMEKVEKTILDINLKLNILYNALKYQDKEVDMCAVSYFVEGIYRTSEEIMNIF